MLKKLSKEEILLTQQLSRSANRSTDILHGDDGEGADSMGYSANGRNTTSIGDSIADDENDIDSISVFDSASNDEHCTSAAASSNSGDRAGATSSQLDENGNDVPWRGFVRNRPLQALAYTHFCNNW